jgi:hypothetical protein
MARAPSSPWPLLLRSLAVLALLLPVACASRSRSCGVSQWHQGCTTLPLGLDDDRYAKALAYGRGYRCSIAPVAGATTEQMELRIQAADTLLPLMFRRAGIPLAVLDERHFLQDLELMTREIPCPDAGA